MAYKPTSQKVESGQIEAIVSDDNVQQLLNAILKELKKMNIQLELLSDNRVTNQEIE